MSKILITGGSGLLAVNWAVQMRDCHEITLVMHERRINIKGTKSILLPIHDIGLLKSGIEKEKPDLVIHTVALTNVDYCEQDPEKARAINVQLAANMASICNLLMIPLVHISTDHLFTGNKSFVDETEPVQPLNWYAKTKAEAEQEVLKICPSSLVIRTNFYGWGTSYRASFSDFIIGSLRQGKEISLFTDVYYNPILTNTLISSVHELVDKRQSGIFHVLNNDRISKYEFGCYLADQFDLNTKLITAASIASRTELVPRPKDMSLSNAKLNQILTSSLKGVHSDIQILQETEMLDRGIEIVD